MSEETEQLTSTASVSQSLSLLELAERTSSDGAAPLSFLIVYNVSKKHNIGTLARCASAFGVCEVLLVGQSSFNTFGSHGAAEHVAFRHFASLADVRQYVVNEHAGRVLGIEICDGALDVSLDPWQGTTAFLMGNEGTGLSPSQKAVCDGFVYIKQFGSGTASLNVACACAIVLHRFATWAGLQEMQREGEKFVVAPRPRRTAPRGQLSQPPSCEASLRRWPSTRDFAAAQPPPPAAGCTRCTAPSPVPPARPPPAARATCASGSP